MGDPRDWILGDGTAYDFFSRVLAERPSLLLPPLHRVPLRTGNVVEIVGPSPSAKSEILLQVSYVSSHSISVDSLHDVMPTFDLFLGRD